MKKNSVYLTTIVFLMVNTQAIGMASLMRPVTSRFGTFVSRQLAHRLNKPSLRTFCEQTTKAAETVTLARFRGAKRAYDAIKQFGQRITIKTTIAAGLVAGGYYAKTKDHTVQDEAKTELNLIHTRQQELLKEQRDLDDNEKNLGRKNIRIQKKSLNEAKTKLNVEIDELYQKNTATLVEEGSAQILPTRLTYKLTPDSSLIAQGIYPIRDGNDQIQYLQTTPHPWTSSQVNTLSKTVSENLPTITFEGLKKRAENMWGPGKRRWESWQAERNFKRLACGRKLAESDQQQEIGELKDQKQTPPEQQPKPVEEKPQSCQKWHVWPF